MQQENAPSFAIHQVNLTDIFTLHAKLPEMRAAESIEHYINRIKKRPYLALAAYVDNQPIGFKLGYAESEQTFYSWLGGVMPDYRRMGVAKALIDAQEKWAKYAGYKTLSVKSMNRYPGMLRLLIGAGYVIDGYEANGDPMEAKILFSKNITKPLNV
ncbi:GNAT family N-acetyltransferase [Cellvibrio sp. PSBB006]|uniref:GNAT family N-acetyltransferase n=1 Tax=Cellvibrio sp. PSBB006 TaxID=1987723 RepID=UPI000B574DD2|nr:GNAT family N-acetyltransferase [Cellvibrio sp. PSBB006]ARU27913.1 hypothetical protein CBR65_11010 [Cellvibrio sp. PSBB006]